MPPPVRTPAGTYSGKRPHRAAALVVALASLASGCSPPTGDFGRPVPSAMETLAATIPAPVRAAILPVDPPFASDTLSAVEHEARDRLWHFRQPLPPLPATSAAARYNALSDAVGVEIALIETLLPLRPAVAAKDAVRAGALAALPDVPVKAADHAGKVARDNALLFADLCRLTRQRARQFRARLEHQVLIAPETEAVPAERRLLHLEAVIREACGGPPPDAWRAPSLRSTPRGTGKGGRAPAAAPLPLVRKF